MTSYRTTKGTDEAKAPPVDKGGADHAPCNPSTPLDLDLVLDDGHAWTPIRAFRLRDARRVAEPPRTEFLSSGSTQSVRARHSFSGDALAAYARESARGFVAFLERAGLAPDTPIVSLVPRPQAWPTSSLAAMIFFFAKEGLDVHWHDVETPEGARDVGNAVERAAARARDRGAPGDVVVFGTSFHHVLVGRAFPLAAVKVATSVANPAANSAANPAAHAALVVPNAMGGQGPVRTLLVVDTGGTKGRTESLDSLALRALLERTYADLCETLRVGSEYGMCELASQAYGVDFPHSGRFECNRTLEVCTVDLRSRRVLPFGEKGFLAFHDALNYESYTRVVTEDLGVAHDARTFTLLARAPDATAKGCSLNVKDGFFSASHRIEHSHAEIARSNVTPAINSPGKHESAAFEASSIARELADAGVSQGLIADLMPALLSVEEGFSKLAELAKFARLASLTSLDEHTSPPRGTGGKLYIVASANVPVVFLYPLVWAWAGGWESCELKLPSLREDDPLAARTRSAQAALFSACAARLPGLACHAAADLDLTGADAPHARLLVFGSDATCATFLGRYPGRVDALGDFANAVDVCGLTPESACSRLTHECVKTLGRGCLTPLAFFADANLEAGNCADALSALLEARYTQEGVADLPRWMHAQDVLEIAFVLGNAGLANPRACLHERGAAWVVDLRDAPEGFPFRSVPFTLGGAGLVFLLPGRARLACAGLLAQHPTSPGLHDPHQGLTWNERLESLRSRT